MSAVEALAEVIRDEIQKYPKLDAPIHGQIGWGATEHTIATALVAAIRSMPAEQVAELIDGEVETRFLIVWDDGNEDDFPTQSEAEAFIRSVNRFGDYSARIVEQRRLRATPWSPLGVSPETNGEQK